MRILYLHQYFNTPKDRGGTRSYEMARRFVSRGHEVDMVTTRRDPSSRAGTGWELSVESGIRVHRLPVPYANAMPYSRRIKAFLRFAVGASRKAASLEADVVFATSTPLTVAFPGVYAARRRKIPMVFEVRDLWPELPVALGALRGAGPIRAAKRLERWAYRNSDRIVALSPGMKEGIVRTGYPGDRVRVIPNGADLELFDVPRERGREFRSRYPWLGDRPLVVYAGALGKINGVDYLARLAAAAAPAAPDVRFVTVGEGGEKERIRKAAEELGVLGKSFFMLDGLPKDEMPSVLSAADVALSLFIDLPPMWNNSANKFFDALASGTAVAINYGGWQADILAESAAGLVLDARSTDRAAAVLIGFLRDQDRLERTARAARRLAEERFSRDALAGQLEAVLAEAVSAAR